MRVALDYPDDDDVVATMKAHGAVGVSGVQSHEDEQVCNAGIAALTA